MANKQAQMSGTQIYWAQIFGTEVFFKRSGFNDTILDNFITLFCTYSCIVHASYIPMFLI